VEAIKDILRNEAIKSRWKRVNRSTKKPIESVVRKQMVTIVDCNQYNIHYHFHNTMEIILHRWSGLIVPRDLCLHD